MTTLNMNWFSSPKVDERVIRLPNEVSYRYLKIEHDMQPLNNYSLSNAQYASDSIVMKSVKSLTPAGPLNYVQNQINESFKRQGQ